MRTISDMFLEQKRQPIDYEGLCVYSRWPMSVRNEDRVVVELTFRAADLRQAVELKIKPGTVELEGLRATHFILWADEAPPTVPVLCHPGRNGGTLWIWNSWESPEGRVDAGLNNAGILVREQQPDRVVLACSPGLWASKPPDFDAVEVIITVQHGQA